jgi:hypothetical protein
VKALNPGDRLGPYEIVGPPHVSGAPGVYRARDTRGGGEVSIKLLSGHPLPAADLAEARSYAMRAATLMDSGLITVYDVRTDGGIPYVVFEVLRGETLGARLQRAPLATPEALGYALQLARGLAVAHDRGLVHAGLARENVLLGSDGRARVLDFVAVDRAPDSAPALGPRRDVEAWGRLAGEMLAGGSPRAVRAVLERSLESDPARAYASARDLVVAFEQAAAQADAEPPPPARWALWRLWLWVTLAALTGTVAALLVR